MILGASDPWRAVGHAILNQVVLLGDLLDHGVHLNQGVWLSPDVRVNLGVRMNQGAWLNRGMRSNRGVQLDPHLRRNQRACMCVRPCAWVRARLGGRVSVFGLLLCFLCFFAGRYLSTYSFALFAFVFPSWPSDLNA